MVESLQTRSDEGKSPLQGEELLKAASVIGYGFITYSLMFMILYIKYFLFILSYTFFLFDSLQF